MFIAQFASSFIVLQFRTFSMKLKFPRDVRSFQVDHMWCFSLKKFVKNLESFQRFLTDSYGLSNSQEIAKGSHGNYRGFSKEF